MYNITTIQTELNNLVTWRQNEDPNNQLSTSFLGTNESGLYYQDAHPFLTINNLKAVSNRKLDSGEFETWLSNKTKSGIAKAVENFLHNKTIYRNSKPVFKEFALFEGAGAKSNTIPNNNEIAGLEFALKRSKGLTVKIEKIGFQGNAAENFTLYLYHSSQNTAIKTVTMAAPNANSMNWITPTDWLLENYDSATDSGGAYYLVYNQSDLNGLAINKAQDFTHEPCSGCSREYYNNWNLYTKLLNVMPFRNDGDIANLFPIEDNKYTYTTNYGLNVVLSIYCDYTDFIVDQKQMFKEVIQKQVAIDLLRELAYNANAEINRNVLNISKNELLYDIDGDNRGIRPNGMRWELKKAFKSLEFDTRGINKICMPCNGNKVKYKSF